MTWLRIAADELLDDYHDDHNWAQWARYELELAAHKDDECPIWRKDCNLCNGAADQHRQD
jgi:hypothetical protein